MGSTFGGINTALSALWAQRRGLDVTGENIANVNTEGYSRQRVQMQQNLSSVKARSYATTDGIGEGVRVSGVERMRSEFLENRARTEHGQSAYLQSQAGSLGAIEDMFAEPSDTALQSQLHDMWDGWNDVANNPQVPAARSAVLQQAGTVTDTLNNAHNHLSDEWTANRTQLSAYVDEINSAADKIAQYNDTIVQATAAGRPTNELQDQRDTQIMKLAELAGATATERDNGAIDVFIGNSQLVSQFQTRTMSLSGAQDLDAQAGNPLVMSWDDTGTPITLGGTMGGIADTLSTMIPKYSTALDKVAEQLATQVNTVHKAGFSADGSTNLDFFSGLPDGTITAASIKVAITDPDQVATSSTTGTLNNSVADTMADMASVYGGADQTYQSMIGQLGVDAQAANRRAQIQANVTDQVDAARSSESGVNLDEEMTNLLTYQRGYEAASRVLTTIDSMLDQLINRTGMVGR